MNRGIAELLEVFSVFGELQNWFYQTGGGGGGSGPPFPWWLHLTVTTYITNNTNDNKKYKRSVYIKIVVMVCNYIILYKKTTISVWIFVYTEKKPHKEKFTKLNKKFFYSIL